MNISIALTPYITTIKHCQPQGQCQAAIELVGVILGMRSQISEHIFTGGKDAEGCYHTR